MNTTQLIEILRDDLEYLDEARSALLSHPLKDAWAMPDRINGAFCRLLVVLGTSWVDRVLEIWRGRREVNPFKAYFFEDADPRDRAQGLYEILARFTSSVDRNKVNEFLALLLLRKVLTGEKCSQKEEEWIEKNGYPTDIRKLASGEWESAARCIHHMLASLSMKDLASTILQGVTEEDKEPASVLPQPVDKKSILRFEDLDRIVWSNLERISALLHNAIQDVVLTEEYNWTKGYSSDELEKLSFDENRRLFYLAARRAGQDNYEPFVQHRPLAQEALLFWREHWERKVVSKGLTEECIDRALEVWRSPDINLESPIWSVLALSPDDQRGEVLKSKPILSSSFSDNEILDAFRAGELAYRGLRNITPIILFAIQLPILDPHNTATYLEEAHRAVQAFRLNRAWYYCVEYRKRYNDENLGFYLQMMEELRQ